jgi:hypothetical protein
VSYKVCQNVYNPVSCPYASKTRDYRQYVHSCKRTCSLFQMISFLEKHLKLANRWNRNIEILTQDGQGLQFQGYPLVCACLERPTPPTSLVRWFVFDNIFRCILSAVRGRWSDSVFQWNWWGLQIWRRHLAAIVQTNRQESMEARFEDSRLAIAANCVSIN